MGAKGRYTDESVTLMRLMGDGRGGWRPEFKTVLSRSARSIIAQDAATSIHLWRRVSDKKVRDIRAAMTAYDLLQLQFAELNQEDIRQYTGILKEVV